MGAHALWGQGYPRRRPGAFVDGASRPSPDTARSRALADRPEPSAQGPPARPRSGRRAASLASRGAPQKTNPGEDARPPRQLLVEEMASRTVVRARRPQPRVLLSKQEAATALAMSVRHFERYVQASVPCVYCGQLTLYRVADLERWADSRATPRGRYPVTSEDRPHE